MKKFNFKRDVLIFLFLILIVSLSQFILAKKQLEMGFFTDDWVFLSAYRLYVENPFLDVMKAWKEIGSHNFSYSFYQGTLYNLFGMNAFEFRITNQILKIIATLSLYPLVLYVTKRRLLAFLATFIYAIHYSPFGLLDGASRGGNFIAVTLMNLFLLAYFYVVRNKISSIFVLSGLAGWMFTTILIATTRLFPLLFIVMVIEMIYFSKTSIKRLLVLYSPLLLLFLFSPGSITAQLSYPSGLFEKLREGNWQLLLTPFAALGSTYIPRNLWILFSNPTYQSLSSYLAFFLPGPIFIFFLLHISTVFFISKNHSHGEIFTLFKKQRILLFLPEDFKHFGAADCAGSGHGSAFLSALTFHRNFFCVFHLPLFATLYTISLIHTSIVP